MDIWTASNSWFICMHVFLPSPSIPFLHSSLSLLVTPSSFSFQRVGADHTAEANAVRLGAYILNHTFRVHPMVRKDMLEKVKPYIYISSTHRKAKRTKHEHSRT